jgi:hypothetical protein
VLNLKNLKKYLIEKERELALELIKDPEELKDFGNTWHSFHNYSWRNTMLIRFQRKGAELTAGYRAWQAKGRQVKRGEKAIRILAPNPYTKKVKRNGEEVEEHRMSFRTVNTFDVSQTVIPRKLHIVGLGPIEVNDPSYWNIAIGHPELYSGDTITIEQFKKACPFKVDITPPKKSSGWTDFKKVSLNDSANTVQQIATGLHEWAHNAAGHEKSDIPRYIREIEAETIAYIVGCVLGIKNEASKYYVAHWNGTAENMQERANVVLGAAEKIVKAIIKEVPEVGAL